ncbi:DUF3489 domain-containing protein [uncultured Sulfitobacter sp.]|jgi:hypothetical protein|uniref:DUF3489 domain-containing protein n=1 Tax=Sulfitobacter sp. SH22 TaxID=3421172 RepID=UPI0025DE071C|nr:DUF3489 domain-containing protein [uncultured Sulfitobacter sp.]
MPNLTITQSLILTTGAQRADNIAMPLPEGLHGAAAKKVVTMMIDRGWLKEVDTNTRKGEPFWRETGDGHGTTLVVTDAGLLAVGIEPVVVKTMAAVRQHAAAAPAPKTPMIRANTKQAQIIALLQRPEGASIAEIVAVTGWLAHSVRGLISGGLKKKLGLPVTSEKQDGRGTVYSLSGDGHVPSSQPHEEPAQGVTSQQ